jgi:hypothetical protein
VTVKIAQNESMARDRADVRTAQERPIDMRDMQREKIVTAARNDVEHRVRAADKDAAAIDVEHDHRC